MSDSRQAERVEVVRRALAVGFEDFAGLGEGDFLKMRAHHIIAALDAFDRERPVEGVTPNNLSTVERRCRRCGIRVGETKDYCSDGGLLTSHSYRDFEIPGSPQDELERHRLRRLCAELYPDSADGRIRRALNGTV